MCASYGLEIKDTDLPTLDERLVTPDLIRWLKQNAPTTIRPTGPKARNYAPIITPTGVESSWWGMWVGAAPGKFSTINATVERLTTGLWKRPYAQHRVLIPASRYFEYRAEGGPKKQRYAFHLPDDRPFAFAGIAAPMIRDELDGIPLPSSSYALITREPTEYAAEIHNRMPLVLPPSFYDDWLDPERAGDDELRAEALAASEEIVGELRYDAA